MTTPHMTPRILVAVILAAIAVSSPLIAQRVAEPELLLREALHKQQVEGDLPGAIRIYQQIVSAKSSNRAVTARALLELAGCYEKLGQQAHTVYQQIIRDFSEQPAAAQARARLAALRPATPAPAMTLRRLELGHDAREIFATDGQRAVFIDSRLTLYIGDLAGKEKRVLSQVTPTGTRTSPDLSLVGAYRSSTQQISIIRTDGSGERVLDLRENGRPLRLSRPGPLSGAWSWDNRYILMTTREEAGSRLLRITVADGSVTEVLPGLRGVRKAEFSPDGKFIAYRQALTGATYVVPASGGESHLIATESEELVGWTRDGRYVLLRESTPRNANGWVLSAVPVQDGRKRGELIVRRSIPAPGVRTMMNGSLFVSAGDPPLAVRDTWLGTLDEGDASVTWKELDLVAWPIPSAFTPWSPDGSRFAYVTGDPATPMRVVRVMNIITGEDRELYRGERILGCVAARGEDVLFCAKRVGTNTEVVSVSLDSGRAEFRGALSAQDIVEQMTADDRKIIFYGQRTNSWIEWEIATGEERPLAFYRSGDGRWGLIESTDSSQRQGLRIRPATSETDWRLLVARRVPPPGDVAPPWRFSPDGNWVMYHDRDTTGKDGLYRIATSGGDPQRLGDYPTGLPTSAITISSDGRRLIVHAPKERQPAREHWVLENFIPAEKPTAAPVTKRTGK